MSQGATGLMTWNAKENGPIEIFHRSKVFCFGGIFRRCVCEGGGGNILEPEMSLLVWLLGSQTSGAQPAAQRQILVWQVKLSPLQLTSPVMFLTIRSQQRGRREVGESGGSKVEGGGGVFWQKQRHNAAWHRRILPQSLFSRYSAFCTLLCSSALSLSTSLRPCRCETQLRCVEVWKGRRMVFYPTVLLFGFEMLQKFQ